MKMGISTLRALVASVSFSAGAASAKTLSCKLSRTTDVMIGSHSGKDENPFSESQMEISIKDYDKGNPTLLGNVGTTKLVRQTAGEQPVVYFLEVTDLGNLNVFTLFTSTNHMLLTKQYNYIGRPYGLLMYGKCNELKTAQLLHPTGLIQQRSNGG